MEQKLKKKREKLIKRLPGLDTIVRGTLRKVFAPCGKKKCKCKKGFLHGPYYYLAVTTKGKTNIYYLPTKQMAKKTEKAIEQYNKLWAGLCKISEINIKLIKKGKK